MSVPAYGQVQEAARLVAPWVRRTPVMEVDVEGRPVVLKLEQLQHTGSFKVRGAFTSVLTARERPDVLVAASGGNHGLAVAHVGRALGIPARVYVPDGAPAIKVDAIAALGAEVTRAGATYAEALAASREAGRAQGALVLHAYDAPGTVIGQATVGLEVAEQVPDVDTVVVAVGGGGLASGVTLGLGSTGTRVVGVEPESCATLRGALDHGGPVDVPVGGVAADALGASRLGDLAYEVLHARVDSRLVTDGEIVRARRWLWRHVRVATEPAGATALAALLGGDRPVVPGERVCVVVCGANADPATL